MLYGQNRTASLFGLINAGILFYVLYGKTPDAPLFGWFAFVVIPFLGRSVLRRSFHRLHSQEIANFDSVLWERLFAGGVFLAGVSWGLAGAFLIPDSIGLHVFLGFLIAGSTAGASVAYSASIPSMQAYLLPAVLPFAARLVYEGGELYLCMAALMALYVVFFSAVTIRMNKTILQAIRLGFEKDQLLAELKDTQAKITQTAKMSALGEMAAGIAHEINNPLGIIRGNCQLLKDQISMGEIVPDDISKTTEKIDGTVERIAKIVTGLRSFAREADGEPLIETSVAKIVADTLDFCQSRFKNHGVSLKVDRIDPALKINCRDVEISQVLLNLLNNAFDAVEGHADPWVQLLIRDGSGSVVFSVIDSGTGVSPELREKIMQPFFTTKEVGKGTGLGLSISTGIIASHGGRLWLDLENPRTCFSFTLNKPQPLTMARVA